MKIKSSLVLMALACVPWLAAQARDRAPVGKSVQGYSLAEAMALERQFAVETLLAGGDVALYANTRLSQFMHTAALPRRVPYRALAAQPNPAIGAIRATSRYGEMSLDDFLKSPQSFAQGFVVVHRGVVVYESYPGMKPADSHFWASAAKPMSSMLVEQLIDEGKIDQKRSFGEYVPDFRGTAWEHIPIVDILNMSPGLDTEENNQTRADPKSIVIRLFRAELGNPDPVSGKPERVRDILKAAKKVREPGTTFDYGSPVTQALVVLVEEVCGKRFAEAFDERVWSHVSADGDLQLHLAPDGLAGVHGMVSSRLRDLARFGMLYTPSWPKASNQRVVSDAALRRIRTGLPGGDFFMKGFDGPIFTEALNDRIVGNSRQWDAVFEDGDIFKLGFMGQGVYVSPDRDLVIAFFSTNPDNGPIQRYLRPIATWPGFRK